MGLEVRGMDGIGAAPSRRGLYGSGEEEMGTDWSGGDRKGTDGMGQVSQSKEIRACDVSNTDLYCNHIDTGGIL